MPQEAPSGGRTRVLVIEDEPRMTELLKRLLAEDPVDVDTADDGRLGLALGLGTDYDLVVLDLMLPKLDGIAVLTRILAARPEQQVLVLSALADVDWRVQCLELGAADYMTKPFATSEFVARVRARLRNRLLRPKNGLLSVGPIAIDLGGRAAVLGERRVPLGDREFLVLERLMRAAGEPCSRATLLADVWGYCFEPGSRLVESCVERLRKKLGEGLIESIGDDAYRLAT